MQIVWHWESSAFATGTAVTIIGLGNAPSDLTTVAGPLVTAYIDNLQAEQSSDVNLVQVDVLDDITRIEAPTAHAGMRSGELENVNDGIIVKMSSSLRGRKNRGRNFWPGFVNSGDVDPGGFLTTRAGGLTTDFINFYTEIGTTDGWGPVILHKDGSAPTPVDEIAVQDKIGSQRRRIGR
jgi:hypothetical protein